MRWIFAFEMKKIWHRKLLLLCVAMVLVIVLDTIATGGHSLVRRLNGQIGRLNQETHSYWGMTVTDELHEIAKEKALAYGAEASEIAPGFIMYSIASVWEKYGVFSDESTFCTWWINIINQPTLEEELRDQILIGAVPEGGTMEGRAAWVVTPWCSVWNVFLESLNYSFLLSGLAVLVLIFVLCSDVFSREEGGGLREISLSKPRRKQLIACKILASTVTGMIVALFIFVGDLLYNGFLYGFHGWNLDATAFALGGGYVSGHLARPVSAMALSLLKLALIVFGGAFFAVLVASLSALLRNVLAATGAGVAVCVGMESLLYLLLQHQNRILRIGGEEAYTKATLLCSTPMRLFLNVEDLAMRHFNLYSAYNSFLLMNMLLRPGYLALFLLPAIAFMALCAALCFTYQRER